MTSLKDHHCRQAAHVEARRWRAARIRSTPLDADKAPGLRRRYYDRRRISQMCRMNARFASYGRGIRKLPIYKRKAEIHIIVVIRMAPARITLTALPWFAYFIQHYSLLPAPIPLRHASRRQIAQHYAACGDTGSPLQSLIIRNRSLHLDPGCLFLFNAHFLRHGSAVRHRPQLPPHNFYKVTSFHRSSIFSSHLASLTIYPNCNTSMQQAHFHNS